TGPTLGPAEPQLAATAGGECRANLPVERARLTTLAVAQGVEAQLAHEERPVPGDVLQARQVRLEALLRLEIDVEADEIEEREPEVFGRGVVDVRHQPLGVFLLDDPVEPLEVTLDLAAAKPARHQ